jgi:hypothetical protein
LAFVANVAALSIAPIPIQNFVERRFFALPHDAALTPFCESGVTDSRVLRLGEAFDPPILALGV